VAVIKITVYPNTPSSFRVIGTPSVSPELSSMISKRFFVRFMSHKTQRTLDILSFINLKETVMPNIAGTGAAAV
jgi:hypothetical protein